MGISNMDGALFMATGIDNSGLYKGKKEAMGIIKAMARQITSFDVFGGIGISAGIAFASAAKDSYEFAKQFESSMREVQTISDYVRDHMEETKEAIIGLTTDKEIAVGANEMSKALYQIVSAGHDGADAMTILEQSGKAAVGGLTETATAADAITTLLNAYKEDASKAEETSDMLFTTAKLGKTTFGELGKSISQVAPIAASFGIEMDQVLAAVATLTKSGVPTAQAMTQIRASIISASKVLGDGAFKTMTYQEGLQKIADMAGGSEARLRELIPEIEGMNGVLGLTGLNAKAAASDLDAMSNSLGATEKAFQDMKDSAENQLKLFKNNIVALLRPLGEGILKEISSTAKAFNEAFSKGEAPESIKALGDLIVVVTGAFVGYKGALMLASVQQRIHAAVTEITRYEVSMYNAAVKAGTIAENANTLAQIKNTAVRRAMISAIRLHTAALIKNAAAALANPYVLAAAAVAALGYAFYKAAQHMSVAEQEQQRVNKRTEEHNKQLEDEKNHIDSLLAVLEDEQAERGKKIDAFEELKSKYSGIFGMYKTEEDLINDITAARKRENEQIKLKQKLLNIKDNAADQKRYNDMRRLLSLEQKGEAGRRRMGLQGEYERLFDTYEIDKTKSFFQSRESYMQQYINEAKKTIGKGQAEIRKAEQDEWLATVETLDDAAAAAQKKKYENYLKSLTAGSKEWIQIEGATAPVNADILKKRITVLTREHIEVEKKNAQQYRAEALKAWKDAKKEVEKVKNGKTEYKSESDFQNELKRKLDLEKAAKERYERLGGKTTTTDKTDPAVQLKKDQQKYREVMAKQAIESKRAAEDLQMQVEEGRIAAMNEGDKKMRASMALNFEKQMIEIDREKEDLLQKKIDKAKEAFEANPANKNKVFDDKGIKLSDDELKAFDEKYKNAIALWEKTQEDFNRKSQHSWNEYLKMYGDYLNKRAAIIALGKEQMEQASTDGERATIKKQMDDELDALDNSVRESTTLIAQLLADTSRMSIGEIDKIIKRAELLLQYLQAVKDSNGNANIGGKNVSEDDILSLGVSKNTLENLKNSPNEVQALSNAIRKLKGELGNRSPFVQLKNQIKDAMDLFNKGGKENIAKGIEGLGKSITEFAPAASEFGRSLGTIFGSDDLGKKISGIAESFSGLAQTGMGIGQIMSGDIVGGAMGVVGGISGVISSLDGLFGADYSRYNKMKKQYEALNKVWDELIDKKKEYLSMSYGDEVMRTEKEINQIINKSIQSYRELGKERLNSGASIGSHSQGVRQRKRMSSSDWEDARRALGYDFYSKEIGKGRMTGLFDLTEKQLEELQEKAPKFWAKLDEDAKSYLENIIKKSKELEAIQEQTKERITGTSFDSLLDSFWDSILSLDKAADAGGEKVGKSLQKAIIKNALGEDIQKDLKEWRDKFSAAVQSKASKDVFDDLKKQYEDLQKRYNNQAKALSEQYGFDMDEKRDGVKGKLEAALTEGTANQLVGLWNMTALDIRIIKEALPDHFRVCQEMRIDLGQVLLLAKEISINTGRTAENTQALNAAIAKAVSLLSDIKLNTKTYNGRG